MYVAIFRTAFAAISSGEYSDADVSIVRQWLEELNKKEATMKRKIEKNKNEFVKTKDKSNSELKLIKTDIKAIKNILKAI